MVMRNNEEFRRRTPEEEAVLGALWEMPWASARDLSMRLRTNLDDV